MAKKKKKAARKTSKKRKKARSKASSAKKKTRAKAAKKKTSKKKKASKQHIGVLVRRRNSLEAQANRLTAVIHRRMNPPAKGRSKKQRAATVKLGSMANNFFKRNAQAREDRQALE